MRHKIFPPIAICLLFLLSIGGIAKSKSITVTGWVSDEACGATHTKPGGEDCVLKCLRGGAHIGHPEWKAQRMVFVTDKGKKIWIVENPEALKGYEGRHLKITARLNSSKKSVHIETASELEV